MRYHYAEKSNSASKYSKIYICDHPVYNVCTLYSKGERGLAVIQQDYILDKKTTYWRAVDSWLASDIYRHDGFKEYFKEKAGPCKDGLYPTVTVRQIMWALKMKPLVKQRWETVFDRRLI